MNLFIKVLALIALLSCSHRPERMTITGLAIDEKEGAAVKTSDETIYLDNLRQWPREMLGKQVQVTGRPSTRELVPLSKARSEVLGGMAPREKILLEPVWKTIF